MSLLLACADARKIPLADNTVQCCVTSPPYWGLRRYAGEQELVWGGNPECGHELDGIGGEAPEIRTGLGLAKLGERYRGGGHKWAELTRVGGGKVSGKQRWNHSGHGEHGHGTSTTGTCVLCGAWRGAYGLEPTIEMYVAHTVEILREIRRVLRADGVVFFNIGDSYASTKAKDGYSGTGTDLGWKNTQSCRPPPGLKPKDLCLIPQRVALAAQADGWWVRSMIVWAKPNPMPESVTDRPTDAYEHIIMVTKNARYFWDAEAVREQSVEPERKRADQFGGNKGSEVNHSLGSISNGHTSRNLRNIWTFATQPYSGAHFATFPEELPRRCILAATSTKGACMQCGAPWEQVIKATGGTIGRSWNNHEGDIDNGRAQPHDQERLHGRNDKPAYERELVGWRPTCLCRGQHGKTQSCLVLDPFAGSGTTGRVAIELRRRAILLDLAYGHDYGPLAKKRTSNVQTGMFR